MNHDFSSLSEKRVRRLRTGDLFRGVSGVMYTGNEARGLNFVISRPTNTVYRGGLQMEMFDL